MANHKLMRLAPAFLSHRMEDEKRTMARNEKSSSLDRFSNQGLDRFSWLWLVTAVVLSLFSGGRWAIALAAWFAPLFLLRFVRTQRPLTGFLLAWLIRSAAGAITLQGVIPAPGYVFYPLVAFLSLVTTLPYLADRLIAPQLQGIVATLIFPTAYTALEYIGAMGPFGSFSSMANTQYGNLPLMQVVAVTGIWGITFLITWFASVANWAWEHEFNWREMRGGVLLYAAIFSAVMIGGGARLALFPPQANLVRVAGVSAPQAVVSAVNQQLPMDTTMALTSGKGNQAERALARSAYATVSDDLLARSQQEAAAGAKIVVWPEAGASVLQEDEPTLIQRAAALAKQEGIYLDMGLAVLPNAGSTTLVKDEAVLLDPTGSVVWTYEKTHLVPFEETGTVVPGAGKVPLVNAPFGILANVICFDLDFPGTIRQAGQGGADLLLAPSNDWQEVDPIHTQAAAFRAIENGFSLVRQASHGLAMTVDYEGHVLAASDYFTTDQQVMVASVPMHGVRTIYAAIGDLFAWLCIVNLAACAGLAILRSRGRQSTSTAPATSPVSQSTSEPNL
jgi:apolipoprotein N-acyltransferase